MHALNALYLCLPINLLTYAVINKTSYRNVVVFTPICLCFCQTDGFCSASYDSYPQQFRCFKLMFCHLTI
jgi:hypothetical protein